MKTIFIFPLFLALALSPLANAGKGPALPASSVAKPSVIPQKSPAEARYSQLRDLEEKQLSELNLDPKELSLVQKIKKLELKLEQAEINLNMGAGEPIFDARLSRQLSEDEVNEIYQKAAKNMDKFAAEKAAAMGKYEAFLGKLAPGAKFKKAGLISVIAAVPVALAGATAAKASVVDTSEFKQKLAPRSGKQLTIDADDISLDAVDTAQ